MTTYFLQLSLTVNGHPCELTSKAPGFPFEAGLQPYLQWTNNSPICSATAMLLTTTVSFAFSTGHFSGNIHTKKKQIKVRLHNSLHFIAYIVDENEQKF